MNINRFAQSFIQGRVTRQTRRLGKSTPAKSPTASSANARPHGAVQAFAAGWYPIIIAPEQPRPALRLAREG